MIWNVARTPGQCGHESLDVATSPEMWPRVPTLDAKYDIRCGHESWQVATSLDEEPNEADFSENLQLDCSYMILNTFSYYFAGFMQNVMISCENHVNIV